MGPTWKGEVPAGITGVVRSPTALTNAIPRVFMDDTAEDRRAIQPVIGQIVFYPVAQFDGTMKTMDWSTAPRVPGPTSAEGGETTWVVPETFFEQLGAVLPAVPPLPSEEALYAQFSVLLDTAARDPEIAKALGEVAVETERKVIAPFFDWRRNGRAAGGHPHAVSRRASGGATPRGLDSTQAPARGAAPAADGRAVSSVPRIGSTSAGCDRRSGRRGTRSTRSRWQRRSSWRGRSSRREITPRGGAHDHDG